VTELWVQRQGAALVRVGANAPAEADKSDLRTWVDRSAVPAGALVAGGLGLGLTGLGLAVLVGWSGLGVAAIYSTMITLGGGLTFLGLIKRKQPPAPALAPPRTTTSPEVLGERARRVHAALDELGDATFEALLRLLGWTEPALLEALVYMKEGGAIEEDLNLDTGEWIYRTRNDLGTGAAGGLMLEDRQARADARQR
jgi:hypothetical protein